MRRPRTKTKARPAAAYLARRLKDARATMLERLDASAWRDAVTGRTGTRADLETAWLDRVAQKSAEEA